MKATVTPKLASASRLPMPARGRPCRHCHERSGCRRGGLCVLCVKDPALREQYPQIFPPVSICVGKDLERIMRTARFDLGFALRDGPRTLAQLRDVTGYPIATIEEAIDYAPGFAVEDGLVREVRG
jgi:hypothetical protein